MKKLFVWFACVGMAGFAGCGALDKITADPAEVQNLIDEVTADGGKAQLLMPGVAAKVSIDNADSPIYGAYIDVPAGAVGKRDFDVVAIVKPAAGFAMPSTTQYAVGNPVDINLYRISKDSSYQPQVAVGVGVPVTAATQAVVGHLATPEATELTILADSTLSDVETDPVVVSGSTSSFSPFVGILPDDVDPPSASSVKLPPCVREGVDEDGKVHTRTTYTYDADLNLIKEEVDQGDIDYNQDPPKTTTEPDGDLEVVNTYEYDQFGNRTSTTTDSDGDGSIDSWNTYELLYDTDDRVTSSTRLDKQDNQVSKDLNEYDADGNLIKRTEFGQSPDPNGITTFEYDADGNLIKESTDTVFEDGGLGDDDGDGKPDRFVVYEYEDGLLVKKTYQDADGKDTQVDEFTYDTKGNKIQEIENVGTISGGSESIRNFLYDCWN